MKMFKYYFTDYRCDSTAGIIMAESSRDARHKVKEHYKNCKDIDWSTLEIENVDDEGDGIYEIYYG